LPSPAKPNFENVAWGANLIDLTCHEAKEAHTYICLATLPANVGKKNGGKAWFGVAQSLQTALHKNK